MTQTIEQLTARVRELEEENARLKKVTHISIPTNTMEQWVASEIRKATSRIKEQLTKQRDLAVEALEWAADVLPPSDPGGIGGCDCPVCRALETIKESDVK